MQASVDGLDLLDAEAVHPRRPVFRQRRRPVAQDNRFIGFGFGAEGQTTPGPIAAAFDRLRSPGIALDIPHQRQVITAALNREALVPPLIHMPDADGLVSRMPPVRMRRRHPLHKRRQVPIRPRPQHQMPVVAHQAIAAQPHPEPLNPFGQHRLKRRKILRRLEDPQPTIGPVQHMIYDLTLVNPSLSWHNRQLYPAPSACQSKKVSDPLNFLRMENCGKRAGI